MASSRKFVWLATCPDALQGVPSESKGVSRALSRRATSLNEAALANADVARLGERLNIDWDDYKADHILALAEIELLFGYDDLQKNGFFSAGPVQIFSELGFRVHR